MTTPSNHDNWGWYTTDPAFNHRPAPAPQPLPGAPVEGQPFPNWTGLAWVNLPYVAPPPEVAPVPAPEPARVWPAFDFYRRFTSAERIAIRTLAKTDLIAEDFMHTLDAAISSQINVRSDDPDTQNGLAYLEAMNALAAGRAQEMLA